MASNLPAVASLAELPGGWPDPATLLRLDPASSDGQAIANAIEPKLVRLLADPAGARDLVEELFLDDAFWRDHVALTWSLRTFHSKRTIGDEVPKLLERVQVDPDSVRVLLDRVLVCPTGFGVDFVRIPTVFSTAKPAANCTAVFKVVRLKSGELKVFTATTALEGLPGRPWSDMSSNRSSVSKVAHRLPPKLDILVVGGGHGGLGLSAYLKSLGINHAVAEQNHNIGDNWTHRYDSVKLHTPAKFSQLPFKPYPAEHDTYLTAKELADFYKIYADEFELPVFTGKRCQAAKWDPVSNRWHVTIATATGEEHVEAKLLVFAIGLLGNTPYTPDIPGHARFKGGVLHSSEYRNAHNLKGKRVVIVGGATTACDLALDACRAGAEVTMIQRGETRVYTQEHIEQLLDLFWSKDTPVEICDVVGSEDPMKLIHFAATGFLQECNKQLGPGYYEALEKANFRVLDAGSPMERVFCHGGRHYIDVGACEAIATGKIMVKSDANITSFTEKGLAFDDGIELSADMICLATGFVRDIRGGLGDIVGKDIASQLEPIWGVDTEGEVRGVWRPSGHDRLWVHGGDMQSMRYYGKFLAMQIAAEIDGIRPGSKIVEEPRTSAETAQDEHGLHNAAVLHL